MYVLEFTIFLDFRIINVMQVPELQSILVEAAPDKQVTVSDYHTVG